MARLPTVGGDDNSWGSVLNEFLETAHNADGTLKLDVKTIADLKAIDVATLTDKQQALVAGYSAPGDGGAGVFYYDAGASTADNGGTIIAPTAGSGRWIRNYSGVVNVRWFGAKEDGSTNDTAAWQAAMAASTNVYVPRGDYKLLDCQIPAATGTSIVGDEGARVLVMRPGAAYGGLYYNGMGNFSAPVQPTAVATTTEYKTQSVTKITGAFSGFVPGDICVRLIPLRPAVPNVVLPPFQRTLRRLRFELR